MELLKVGVKVFPRVCVGIPEIFDLENSQVIKYRDDCFLMCTR